MAAETFECIGQCYIGPVRFESYVCNLTRGKQSIAIVMGQLHDESQCKSLFPQQTLLRPCLLLRVLEKQELVEEGKIKGIGLCELPAEELRAAHAIHPISVIEQEYSLFARDVEVCLFIQCYKTVSSRICRCFVSSTAISSQFVQFLARSSVKACTLAKKKLGKHHDVFSWLGFEGAGFVQTGNERHSLWVRSYCMSA